MLNIEFNPIQCTSQVFKNLVPQEGFVYFVTDTKQLFLGRDNKFIDICGGINIVYGEKNIEYVDNGQSPDPNVIFHIEDLTKKEFPLVNDLILNTDGCFYKVKSIDENNIETTRVTLQGSGTGGSSPGSGIGSANIRINYYGGQSRYFSMQSANADLGVIGYSDDPANYISKVELAWDDTFENVFKVDDNLTHPMESPYYISILNYLSKISTQGTRIYLRVTDKYGSTRYHYYFVYIASLELVPKEPELFGIDTDSFDYRCTVGGSLGLNRRTIRYELYGESSIKPVYSVELELEATQIGTITKTLDFSTVPHGDYTLKVQIVGIINGVTIFSNILTHKILRYREDVARPIFSALIPEITEQYTSIPISFLLTYGNTTKAYSVNIIIDDEIITTQSIYAGEVNIYNLSFDTQGSRRLRLTIDELGVTFITTLNIVKYTGDLPVVNIDRSDLKIYLTAKGRTNNAVDKNVWPDAKNPDIKAQLNNFYYRSINGWMKDENNVDYLKVSQGANVVLSKDIYTPFDAENGQTITSRGLTIELDFSIDGVLDYNADLIKCISYYADNTIKTGFCVKGDKFQYFASGKELVSLNLVEGKRIKLTFVIESSESEKYPMCYTYLDGIISNVLNYSSSSDFSNNPAKKAELIIDSIGGQINIYNIRFYSIGLDAQTVLNNYQASIGNLNKRQLNYESNLIRDVYGDIDLEMIESEKYRLEIPYVKIYGGYQADKNFKMANATDSNVPSLPVGKKDFRAIDISIHYPTAEQNSYFSEYKDFNVTTTFADPALNVINGFGKTPEIGAIMYAQGTSSLEYPVKNLRVKLLGKKFTVKPDIEPVKLVTFKADFMESSGSHNTGAANYIDTLYEYVGMKTPGQEHFEGGENRIVTCIKGHPCVIFWNPGVDEKGNVLDKDDPKNYTYIGKYNFNLDKATPEPFGFMNDKNDEKFGYEVDENGELILIEGKKVNSIHCFEFLDNNEKVCNFESDPESSYIGYNVNDPSDKQYEINTKTEQERYEDTWYSLRKNENGDIVPGWARGFESRYPELDDDEITPEAADSLRGFAEWLNNLYTMRYIDGNENAVKIFRNEYQQYLDTDYLLAYYIITEALLMADSRVKNMMIATWGKEHRSWIDDDGVEHNTFDYVWYPLFYDMDTMLGLDNIGYVNKNYYDEDTTEKVFNGDEILWKFTRDALSNELAKFYNRAEQANGILTKAAIVPYFNDNQGTMANETFYNEDAFYKYIDTFRNGYTDHLHDKYIAPGTGSRLYAAQGSRGMSREFFIDNRIKYLRGKYLSTNYQESDRIEFRLTYPKETIPTENVPLTEEDIKTNASILAVPPTGDFKYKSAKTGYAGVKVGTSTQNHRFINEEEFTLTIDTSSGNGTETYLYGISNLSDIGDLSDKYLYKPVFGATQNNLTRLILGNHHKDYYNPFWKDETLIELSGCRFLNEFNLENCSTFKGDINFSEAPQIKKILLNGSSTGGLILPVGGVLEELRIPPTVRDFAIDSHPTLEQDKFTIGTFNYDTNQYENDYSKLTHIYCAGVPGIDTYAIARGAIIENPVLVLESYCFKDINWVIDDPNDFEYSDNGNVEGIKVLDIMLSSLRNYSNPETGYVTKSREEALTGTITINIANKTINEFDIYQKYHFNYPNLTIKYGDNAKENLQAASTINFYNIEEITEATESYYTVLSNGEYTLTYLTSQDTSPAGSALQPPVKIPEPETSYTFTNIWQDASNASNKYVVNNKFIEKTMTSIDDIREFVNNPGEDESGNPIDPTIFLYKINIDEYVILNDNIEKVIGFNTAVPKGDLKLIPIFIASDRLYEVSFYDDEGNLINNKSYYYKYKQSLFDNVEAPIYYNKDDSGLLENERYGFQGWISDKDFINNTQNPTYYDLDTLEVTYNLSLYARCIIEDVTKIATNPKYFNIQKLGTNIAFNAILSDNNRGYTNNWQKKSVEYAKFDSNTICISIRPEYRNHIGGKITLPSWDATHSKRISIVWDMNEIPNMTECHFLGDSSYVGIGEGGYNNVGIQNCVSLKKVVLPASMRYIGTRAFYYCGKLENIIFNEGLKYIGSRAFAGTLLGDVVLPDSIERIEEAAFINLNNFSIKKLPLNLTEICPSVFSGCGRVEITSFGFTVGQDLSALDNNVTIIGPNAFNMAGSNSNISEITLKDSIIAIGDKAFNIYGGFNDIKVFDESEITSGWTESGESILHLVFNTQSRQVETPETI